MRDGITKKMREIRDLLDSRRQDIIRWIDEGSTLEKMGNELGVNYGTVRNYCLRTGIQHNTKRGWRIGSHTGADHHHWKGGRHQSPDGYVWVKAPPGHPGANSNGRIREHRFVMEQILGRHLLPGEVVHHKDGDKANNRPENLVLYPSNADHMRQEHTGRKLSDESRKRLSDARKGKKGKPQTQENRERMRALMTGRKFSPETIQRMRDAKKNRKPMSEEQRKALSESLQKAHSTRPEWGKKAGAAMKAAMTEKRQSKLRQADQTNDASLQTSESDDQQLLPAAHSVGNWRQPQIMVA
jgi:hypothetical protein